MDPKKVQTVIEWRVPTSIRDLQCFLGFANFYRIFIKNYSSIATPLTQLTDRDKLEWSTEVEKGFYDLKIAFI